MVFKGFIESEFEAYRAPRASSNAFNRPRLEARQKAVSIAKEMHARALAAGTALELHASDEHPSVWNKKKVDAQWVFLWRDAAARARLDELLDQGRTLWSTFDDPTPYVRHAFLAIHLDADGVDIGFRVNGRAWADARNLSARVTTAEGLEALVKALSALPEGFTVGVTGEAQLSVSELTGERVRTTVDALSDERWWAVTRRVTKAVAVGEGDAITEKLIEGFVALLPVYHLVAWSESNDLVSIARSIDAAHARREANVQALAEAEAVWQSQNETEIARRREVAQSEAQARSGDRDRGHEAPRTRPSAEVPPRGIAKHAESVSRGEETRRSERRVESRQVPRVPGEGAEAPVKAVRSALAVGDRVKVQSGPFSGRSGVITELDERGVRVSFGLLSTRIAMAELQADGAG